MRFNIHGHKIKVTEPIKSYIELKIGKLDKYFDDPDNITATVMVKVRGKDQTVEVTIPIKKYILRGEETHKDLYAAIDLVLEKLERQIRKNKTRMKKKINKDLHSFNIDFKTDKEDKDVNKVVKRKLVEMKPMSEEEAILQLELLGHDFFVFEDMNTHVINVLYKRKDGNYGMMEIR